ncbi:X-linked retinitis pigmentosa GTPase regulator-interacting protein 1-like isoform X2 [Xiphophorus maculatus]|uniref:X-linked retinitis pigmentosa GTPase regulator-interacting protein 1-like isoform X2 n=1 Tax=Xiphophorus maculatus TaxID=8083 RepID=UPI000C6CFE47|nr:X-linked retinitis pigmentosa GTPase regulator-interacting protein 1-like isoform X2 [Xiphophorus maculatus]
MEGGTEPAEEEKEKDPNHIPVEHQEFPIMHWEELSQRIAELEKQEQERREKRRTGLRTENVWEEEEEDGRRGRVAVSTSRLNHRNLQLCFINNSDSEDDDEEEGAERKVPMGAGHNGCHGSGLKQEVAAALRALRDDLLAEQRQQESQASCSGVAQRKHLEHRELQDLSETQLIGLRGALQQEVHGENPVRAGGKPGQDQR